MKACSLHLAEAIDQRRAGHKLTKSNQLQQINEHVADPKDTDWEPQINREIIPKTGK